MAFAAEVYIGNKAIWRDEERSPLAVGAVVRSDDALPIEAEVRNLSRTGCLVAMEALVDVGSVVTIGISGIGKVDAQVVRRTDDQHGCQFLKPISRAMVYAAHGTNTVVAFPSRSFMSASERESTMPDLDRWSRGARISLLIVASISLWAAVLRVMNFI